MSIEIEEVGEDTRAKCLICEGTTTVSGTGRDAELRAKTELRAACRHDGIKMVSVMLYETLDRERSLYIWSNGTVCDEVEYNDKSDVFRDDGDYDDDAYDDDAYDDDDTPDNQENWGRVESYLGRPEVRTAWEALTSEGK